MRRSANPVTAAITSILKPAMRERGFAPLGGRAFARMNGCIVQEVIVQLTMHGGRDFGVNYATDTLCFPFEAFTMNWGERLSHIDRVDKWWRAETQDEADRSMCDVLATFDRVARRHLDAVFSPEAFVAMLAERDLGKDHHGYFQLGATQALLDRREDAISSLNTAITHYERDLIESRALGYGREWAVGYQAKARDLIAAIDSGRHPEVLDTWIKQRRTLLKLDKIGPN